MVGENEARVRRSVRDLHIPHLRSHRDRACRFCYASKSLERMRAEDCGVFLGVSPPRSVGDRGCSSFELVEVIRIVAAEHTALDLLDGATGEYDLFWEASHLGHVESKRGRSHNMGCRQQQYSLHRDDHRGRGAAAGGETSSWL